MARNTEKCNLQIPKNYQIAHIPYFQICQNLKIAENDNSSQDMAGIFKGIFKTEALFQIWNEYLTPSYSAGFKG